MKDGLIHKEEFCLALFRERRDNLFATRASAPAPAAAPARGTRSASAAPVRRRRPPLRRACKRRGAAQVFEVFDEKKNNVIEFGEFVRALSVFHPKAPLQEKAALAFRIYDLGNTGTIDHSGAQAPAPSRSRLRASVSGRAAGRLSCAARHGASDRAGWGCPRCA